ncbi:MAG: transglycosylase SLT domain-containing protein [Thermodesulfobacteriota bacterium]|nr:transglycosylase SLT domain-containing protein [Thermodesulfobacteriota bacterium]
MRNSFLRTWVFITICGGMLCLPRTLTATIFSFTDDNGVVHFSNVPNDPRYRPVASRRIRYSRAANYFRYDPYISVAARRFSVDPLLVKAIISAESDFVRTAVSNKGAKGLMQLMPETINDMKVSDPFDAEDNITGGTRYLSRLLKTFKGDLNLTLAAYNAGPTVVKKIGRVPEFTETRNYVNKVIRNYKKYQAVGLNL